MQTDLPAELLATDAGARADAILRSCVHCGFCNATCPTYQLLGDELDGPRGRIYLIKDMLETGEADAVTRTHLDRCLTCRACETTCPSGVRYGELLEIGRERLETELPRRARERWLRRWLLAVVPRRRRFRRWVRLGRLFRPFLPRRLAAKVPPAPRRGRRAAPAAQTQRRVLVLDGCVQSVTTPGVNDALATLLGSRGIGVESAAQEGCCGALALHLGEAGLATATMTANVEALDTALDGMEAVISSASGCGVTVKDYGRLLAGSPAHAAAERVARRTVDAAEFLDELDTTWERATPYRRVAWQAPCSLQHGQRIRRIRGNVEFTGDRRGIEMTGLRMPHISQHRAGYPVFRVRHPLRIIPVLGLCRSRVGHGIVRRAQIKPASPGDNLRSGLRTIVEAFTVHPQECVAAFRVKLRHGPALAPFGIGNVAERFAKTGLQLESRRIHQGQQPVWRPGFNRMGRQR